MMPCAACGATVHLPDAVWLHLHPVDVVRRWYIRFEQASLEESAADARERAGDALAAIEARLKALQSD